MLKNFIVGITNRGFNYKLIRIDKKYFRISSIFCESLNESTVKFIEENVKKLRIYDEIDLLPANLDWNYLLNEKNFSKIEKNNQNRKGNGDIKALVSSF